MSSLELIHSTSDIANRGLGVKSIWINFIRLLMPLSVLILFYSTTSSHFIHVDFINPAFIFLSLSFLVSAVRLLLSSGHKYESALDFSSYAIDAVMISSVIFSAGARSSVFLVFFFILILLAGIQHKKNGALFSALFCAIAFNFMLFFSGGENYLVTILANDVSFLLVGLLSGHFGEQVRLLGDRVQTQKVRISELEDINKLIVSNISSGLLVVDEGYVVSYANERAEQILGADSLKGNNISHLVNRLAVKISALNLVEKNIERFELEHFVSGSEKRVIEFLVSPFSSSQGASGYILLLQDLTKMRNLELAMGEQERLAAIGELAAGIAHEIRNPLASISGSVQLMNQSDYQTEENKKLMGIVHREVDRLNGLISEFLDFAKPEILADAPIDINKLIEEVCEILKLNVNFRKDVQQKKQLESKILFSGDYEKLKRAFLNIAINAYQAMENTPKAEYRVITYDEQDKVIVKISDTGSGMDSGVKKHIFEPFYTTKDKGTGLGLAITHKLIKSHGAEIFVESELGRGTEFTVEFVGEPQKPAVELKKMA